MPLTAPNLDDRTYEQIYQEVRRRIPIYNPEWTDYNDSDPGITLLQLFSWLTETIIYRLNKVPDRSYIKFLQLLGMELRPAQPAQAHLTFSVSPGAITLPIAARAQVGAQPPDGGDALIFETLEALDLVAMPLSDVQVYDGSAFTNVTQANENPGTTFRPFGWLPQVGSALYLGFSADNPPSGRTFPQKINLRAFLPAEAQAGTAQSAQDVRQPPAPPVTLIWEYKPRESAHWRKLNLFKDESSAFTREGYLAIEGPLEIEPTRVGLIDEPRYWLRCRLNSGAYPAGKAPVLDFVRFNTVAAENLATVTDELVGESEGTPGQIFNLANTPVQPGSLDLHVVVDDLDSPWVQVEDFLSAKPDSLVYTLNLANGEIRFGDGRRGQIPGAGGEIIAQQYRYGGSKAGNVPAGLINAPLSNLPGIASVINTRPAVGGQDEQNLEELKEQAPHRLRSRNRAITAEDFKAIAGQAGGVAKVAVLPLTNPNFPGVDVPGAITLVIVPDNEDMPPRPSSDLIRSVLSFLEPFRLLTTELFVKEPVYRAIQIEARLAAEPYAAFDTVAQEVIEALNQALHPFKRDFGADLYPTSFYNTILDVKDVIAVESITIYVDGRPQDDITKVIPIKPDELVYGSDHHITVVPYEEN